MKKYYRVADHLFSVSSEDDRMWRRMTNYIPFEEPESEENPLFTLDIVDDTAGPLFSCSEREPFLIDPADEPDMPRIDIYKYGEGWIFEFFPTAVSRNCFALLTNGDFSRGRMNSWDSERFGRYPVDTALMVQYVMATSGLRTIGIHASVIVNSGKGLVFLGVSGTGKSTHSRLWLQNIAGSHLLNDDNPVIRVDDKGIVRIYGSPWSGKTPCYHNESAPLAAFVELRQEKENSIHQLDVIESYIAVEASTSGVRQIPAAEEGLFQTIKAALEQVPCYHLGCLPDPAAARLCAVTCGIKLPEKEMPVELSHDEVLPVIGEPRLNR